MKKILGLPKQFTRFPRQLFNNHCGCEGVDPLSHKNGISLTSWSWTLTLLVVRCQQDYKYHYYSCINRAVPSEQHVILALSKISHCTEMQHYFACMLSSIGKISIKKSRGARNRDIFLASSREGWGSHIHAPIVVAHSANLVIVKCKSFKCN